MGTKVSISKKSQFSFFTGIILVSIFFSGCLVAPEDVLREYGDIFIEDVSIVSTPRQEGYLLTVTPYIRNNGGSDSPILHVNVSVYPVDAVYSPKLVGEKDIEIGYVKSKSRAYNNAYFNVPGPGMYEVVVQLFDDENLIQARSIDFDVIEQLSEEQPADIKLTDMNLIVSQFVSRGEEAVVEILPGIYNQGGDSKPLTMIVTARVDPYMVYTESEELGIIKGSNRVRGNVSFVLPRKADYIFSVAVEEDGKEVVMSEIPEPIRLDKIERHITKTYPLVEEGTPPIATEPPEEEPGFQGLMALAATLLASGIIKRGLSSSKKHGK